MNCQIFASGHLFELQMIFSYCDITNRSELLNVSLGGMHKSASAMMEELHC